MKIIKICLAIITALLILCAIAIPAFALANPVAITLHTAKVFENVFATDDMLFMMRYDIDYAATPNTTASDAFLVQLIDTDGTTLLLDRQINEYQHNVISIYATPAQVVSSNLTWEAAYKVRVTGNPAIFPTLTEDTNMDTKTLSASDYNADGTLTSLVLLNLHCIDIAEALESDWAITLLATTSAGDQVLNSAGTVTFLDAVPGLDSALPGLFQLASSIPTITPGVPTAAYAVESGMVARLGPQISGALSGVGDFLGIGDNSAAGLWAMITILTITSIVFLNTGNNAAALVLATPAIVMMTYLGAIPEAITYVVAIFVVVYAMYFFWLRGT